MTPHNHYNELVYSTGFDLSLLQNSIVLEQSHTLGLWQEPLTQLYYICDTQAATQLLRTDQWTVAYQFWLNLLQQNRLSGNPTQPKCLSAIELYRWIERHREHPEFGQLLYSRDHQFQGILQYSVQLSTDHAIRWAPSTNHPKTLGEFILEKVGQRRHRRAKWVEKQPQSTLTDILLRSIEAFHQSWDYNLYQFNSEHWARLIVTGDCCSLQTEELYRYWKNTQESCDTFNAEPEPSNWEINSEIATLLRLALTP